MTRMNLNQVQQMVALGESQRLEFKGDAPLDGTYKNHICREIAAMANGGGGVLLVGVSDGGLLTGLARETAGGLTQSGTLHKLLGERMDPVPEFDAYGVDVEGDRTVVVIEVSPPWGGVHPRYMPVVLTRDVQDGRGRLWSSAGQVIVRTHERAETVTEYRQWDRVMAPILARFRQDELQPMLRALLRQDMLDRRLTQGRADALTGSFIDLPARIDSLQQVHPEAARYEWRLILDGAQLSRQRQHDLVDRASVPCRGWPVPPYITRLVRPVLDGALGFEYPPPGEVVPPNLRGIQEFWMLSPDGHMVASLLNRVDLMHAPQLPPPGPERPLDPVDVCEEILAVVQFAKNAAAEAEAPSLWLAFAIDNVLERPISRALNPSMAIVDRIRWSPLGWPTSNRRRIEIQGEFDAKALAAGWREVAVEWTQRALREFGWPVDPDTVRRFHADLLRLGD
ncbi:MAG: ATP-binding protein [Pseudomonadota bacterium]|nr:ATP-binding protein [Pseudomonadota bacterium]